MLTALESWDLVFQAAGEVSVTSHSDDYMECNIESVIGSSASTEPFTREDVKKILLLSEGCNDGPSWLGLFKLTDGRIAFIDAGCCYTGFGVSGHGRVTVGETVEEVMQFGMSESVRETDWTIKEI